MSMHATNCPGFWACGYTIPSLCMSFYVQRGRPIYRLSVAIAARDSTHYSTGRYSHQPGPTRHYSASTHIHVRPMAEPLWSMAQDQMGRAAHRQGSFTTMWSGIVAWWPNGSTNSAGQGPACDLMWTHRAGALH